jgi:hypothetical protein
VEHGWGGGELASDLDCDDQYSETYVPAPVTPPLLLSHPVQSQRHTGIASAARRMSQRLILALLAVAALTASAIALVLGNIPVAVGVMVHASVGIHSSFLHLTGSFFAQVHLRALLGWR